MSVHENGVDTIVYSGEISRNGYEKITKVCDEAASSSNSKKVNLVLYTYGGDPHAAFRIARALQHHYVDGIRLFVPHYCKSAGTLIAIGASELIISDMGELGPLDVQLANLNEMFERSSGMDIIQGITALKSQAQQMFKDFMIDTKVSARVSTKLASEIATNLTTGLFQPVFAQIDPIRIGEINRASSIALSYGNMLERKFKNIKQDGVERLIVGYPSHAFVIDRKEARDIFKTVRGPEPDEVSLLNKIDLFMRSLLDSSEVFCSKWEPDKVTEQENSNDQANIDAAANDLPTAKTAAGSNDEASSRAEQHSEKPRKSSPRRSSPQSK
ncbi:MAG: hypothetical protein KGO49_07040 [Gammaproteobacteria bacterium]|nr:hypothetical protein [Gammaproteobacteria bacterium]